MILSAIAAMARNRVIGNENKLPWNLPNDLRYFKEKTKGKILIMGRKTFESLGGRPLPGRFHIVITRQNDYEFQHPLVKIVSSLDEAILLAKDMLDKYGAEVFIAGGGEIYKQALPKLDRLYLTVIEQDFAGDAWFPEFDQKNLKLKSKQDQQHGAIKYSFQIYEKQ